MNRKSLLLGIIILLIGVVVVPNFNAQTALISSPKVDDNYKHSYPYIGQEIVWDNGMNYFDDGHPSQRDESYPFEAITADDFQFETEITVTDAYWFGILSHAEDKDFDMEINFYYDRGDGNAPGEIYEGPIFFLNKDTNETYIEGTYGLKYTYNVSFPEPITFEGNVKYWISIQAIGKVSPQWFVGASNNKYQLHECVFKCELLGFPEWTDGFDAWGSHDDICFQLLYEPNNPPDPPIIDGPSRGKPGIEYCWTFNSTNPGNNLYYIDWDDGNFVDWTGPYEFPIEKCHAYAETGTYIIRAKVKYIYGAESDWSEFEIEIPRNRAISYMVFQLFLEQFQITNFIFKNTFLILSNL